MSLSHEMWRRVVWCIVTNISMKHAASWFRIAGLAQGRWVGLVACMKEMLISYTILVCKPVWKVTHGRSWSRREDCVGVDLKVIGWYCVMDWTHLTWDRIANIREGSQEVSNFTNVRNIVTSSVTVTYLESDFMELACHWEAYCTPTPRGEGIIRRSGSVTSLLEFTEARHDSQRILSAHRRMKRDYLSILCVGGRCMTPICYMTMYAMSF